MLYGVQISTFMAYVYHQFPKLAKTVRAPQTADTLHKQVVCKDDGTCSTNVILGEKQSIIKKCFPEKPRYQLVQQESFAHHVLSIFFDFGKA